jgi:hypothetical protein
VRGVARRGDVVEHTADERDAAEDHDRVRPAGVASILGDEALAERAQRAHDEHARAEHAHAETCGEVVARVPVPERRHDEAAHDAEGNEVVVLDVRAFGDQSSRKNVTEPNALK